MSDHKFRLADTLPVYSAREFLRGPLFPNGQAGFVVEDIDATVVLRQFGVKRMTDELGRLLLVEMKHNAAGPAPALKTAQQYTFGLLHDLLKQSKSVRYAGYLVLTHSTLHPADPTCRWWIRSLDDKPGDDRGPFDSARVAQILCTPWPAPFNAPWTRWVA
jgi:hypothetical protein